jgi:hypothetical protein
MKGTIFAITVTAIIGIAASSGYSKGTPDKIVVTCHGASTVEIADREILKEFDPWRGQFIDWTRRAISPPRDVGRTWQVFFYMKWAGRRSEYDRGDLKMIYAARYLPSRDGAPGWIYLPGEGEDFYRNNIATIIRDDDDGKWHQASAEWDTVMNRCLTESNGGEMTLNRAVWSALLPGLEICWLLGV